LEHCHSCLSVWVVVPHCFHCENWVIVAKPHKRGSDLITPLGEWIANVRQSVRHPRPTICKYDSQRSPEVEPTIVQDRIERSAFERSHLWPLHPSIKPRQ